MELFCACWWKWLQSLSSPVPQSLFGSLLFLTSGTCSMKAQRPLYTILLPLLRAKSKWLPNVWQTLKCCSACVSRFPVSVPTFLKNTSRHRWRGEAVGQGGQPDSYPGCCFGFMKNPKIANGFYPFLHGSLYCYGIFCNPVITPASTVLLKIWTETEGTVTEWVLLRCERREEEIINSLFYCIVIISLLIYPLFHSELFIQYLPN